MWEGHKIWKNLPPVLTKQLFLLSSVKTSGRFFSNFVAFSWCLNFMRVQFYLKIKIYKKNRAHLMVSQISNLWILFFSQKWMLLFTSTVHKNKQSHQTSSKFVDSGFMKLSDELINDLMKPCVKVQLQLLKHFSPILHCAPEGWREEWTSMNWN